MLIFLTITTILLCAALNHVDQIAMTAMEMELFIGITAIDSLDTCVTKEREVGANVVLQLFHMTDCAQTQFQHHVA